MLHRTNAMKVSNTRLPEVKILEPDVFEDVRGFFYESFNKLNFQNQIKSAVEFLQDNHSKSSKGVLRGLHYQMRPKSQAKLARVIRGQVFDVAVDIRKSSPTFGQWVGEFLSEENRKQIWIPEGFAHGFLTMSKTAEIIYKTTEFYDPKLERCIRWDDKLINIDWPIEGKPVLSQKDAVGENLIDGDGFD